VGAQGRLARRAAKAAAGLVLLGLQDDGALRAAGEVLGRRARAVVGTQGWAYLLESQHDVRAELYLGCTVDRHFGPVVGIGRGGAHVELEGRVVWSTCPLDAAGARHVLGDERLSGWLRARGVEGAALDAVADAVVRLSGWFLAAAEAPCEVEVNPLAVHRDGSVVALDAVVHLARPHLLEATA
jgi:succinyl-CoA synthetase beta subunit